MKRYAFDVVLLPSQKFSQTIDGLDGRLAHISLAMGVMQETELTHVRSALAVIAVKTPVILIQSRTLKQETEILSTGRKTNVLHVQKTPQLQQLHDVIMTTLVPYATYDGNLNDLFDLNAEPYTLHWINEFKHSSSGRQFSPHITLDHFIPMPPDFLATELALFHLGSYCTCPADGKLGSWNLQK